MKRGLLTRWHRQRLRRHLHQPHDTLLFRRAQALLEFDRGQTAASIAESLDVSVRSVRRWIAAWKRSSDPEALRDFPRTGRPRSWDESARRRLEELMHDSPQRWGYASANWTLPLLGEALRHGGGSRFSRGTIRRGLREQGYVWKRGR